MNCTNSDEKAISVSFTDDDTTIYYIKYMRTPNAVLMKERNAIKHDELDEWTDLAFEEENFMEVLMWSKYRRIYMDLDKAETVDEVKYIFAWLEHIKTVFGEYA